LAFFANSTGLTAPATATSRTKSSLTRGNDGGAFADHPVGVTLRSGEDPSPVLLFVGFESSGEAGDVLLNSLQGMRKTDFGMGFFFHSLLSGHNGSLLPKLCSCFVELSF
jgi:hypothetical protein